jgi:hypothetical protein
LKTCPLTPIAINVHINMDCGVRRVSRDLLLRLKHWVQNRFRDEMRRKKARPQQANPP